MAGISISQGPHQLAQKLMSTGLPRNSLKLTGWPSRFSSVKSGAAAPARGAPSAEPEASVTPVEAGEPSSPITRSNTTPASRMTRSARTT